MKKAFTLVEMSIVLVIIGILMGMTVKGKQLIDSAKLRSDVAVIRNIQTQYHAYLADNNGNVPPKFNQDNLTKGGMYLTDSDLKLKLGDDVTVGRINVDTKKFTPDDEGTSVAVILADGDKSLGCKIDATIDDSISENGTVKAYNVDGSSKPIEFTGCDTAEGLPRYAILIS